MENVDDMLAQQQRELEEIRNKRNRTMDTTALRKVLNILFLIIALIGVVFYFTRPEQHMLGLTIIAIGMVLKIIEFFLRFLF